MVDKDRLSNELFAGVKDNCVADNLNHAHSAISRKTEPLEHRIETGYNSALSTREPLIDFVDESCDDEKFLDMFNVPSFLSPSQTSNQPPKNKPGVEDGNDKTFCSQMDAILNPKSEHFSKLDNNSKLDCSIRCSFSASEENAHGCWLRVTLVFETEPAEGGSVILSVFQPLDVQVITVVTSPVNF